VPAGVAEQRHEENRRREAEVDPAGLHAEPRPGGLSVGEPVLVPLELHGAVPRVAARRRCTLLGRNVHVGGREVGDAAGVVGVEVGDDDVLYVVGIDPPPSQLSPCGVSGVKLKTGEPDRRFAHPSGRVAHVFEADARVNQCHAHRVAQQQAVAAHPRVRRRV
jgi:hypothetical protein